MKKIPLRLVICFILPVLIWMVLSVAFIVRPAEAATLTYVLLPDSLAIDSGGNATCLDTDRRGVCRPQDGGNDNNVVCDIGAYEFSGGSLLNPPTNVRVE